MNTVAGKPSDAAYRRNLCNGISVLERCGIIDFNGHFSVRLEDGNLLINTGSSVRSAITADKETQACQKGLWKQELFEKCWNFYLAKYGLSPSS